MSVIHATPIEGAFAGEITGLDLRAPLDDEQIAAIRAALDRYAVLVIRGEPLGEDEQVAFAERLGEPETPETLRRDANSRLKHRALSDISNLDADGKPRAADDRRRMYALGNRLWHTDGSFRAIPAEYSMLTAHSVTARGGETEFADLRAAYDALDDARKAELATLEAEHSIFHSRAIFGYADFTDEERAALPPVQHPLVRVHPGSGRSTLYLAAHAAHVVGMPVPDGRLMLHELTEHATQPAFVYRHEWRVGDFVIWDNRCTMHRGRPFDERNERRDLRRVSTRDRAFAASRRQPEPSRAAFVAGAAGLFASIAFVRRPADAAEFTYKLGLNQPATHPQSIRAVEAAAKIKEDSGGRFEIQVFPNSALGGDTQMLSQIRDGALELVQMADAITANVVPAAALDSVGFAFSGFKEAWAAMDGPVGAHIRAEIGKTELVAFEKSWDAGFKQITSTSHAIASPDDLHGLRVRVAEAPMNIALYRALGAAPTSINLNELYSSLQTHVVDGADLGLTLVQTGKYYEVQPYLTITNHIWTPFSLLANRAAWERLPKNLRDIGERRLNEGALLERADIERLGAPVIADLKRRGMNVAQPNIEPFRVALRKSGQYQRWRDTFGPKAWSLLEASVGRLA
jgi:tripartite ATP-independent transporter DctP family solute receptor